MSNTTKILGQITGPTHNDTPVKLILSLQEKEPRPRFNIVANGQSLVSGHTDPDLPNQTLGEKNEQRNLATSHYILGHVPYLQDANGNPLTLYVLQGRTDAAYYLAGFSKTLRTFHIPLLPEATLDLTGTPTKINQTLH